MEVSLEKMKHHCKMWIQRQQELWYILDYQLLECRNIWQAERFKPVSARTSKKRKINRRNKRKSYLKSCLNTTELEQILCSSNSSAANNQEGVVDLKASYDIGWQRKGIGRAYNSRSGHRVLIGTESEKIFSYGTQTSYCKQCEVNKVTGQVNEHDCRMNWGGSSKAMESNLSDDMLVADTTESRISTIIIDEDSTSMAKKICVTWGNKRELHKSCQKSHGKWFLCFTEKHHIHSSKVISYLQKGFL